MVNMKIAALMQLIPLKEEYLRIKMLYVYILSSQFLIIQN